MYGHPFFLGHNYPKDAPGTAPEWGQNREGSYLDFDGKGNYIVFPKETVPHAAFTITFDFKPLSGKRQLLLFSYGKTYGPYALFMENCGLHWRFMNQKDEKFEIKTDTGITVGAWNTVKIIYDLSSIMLLVNNKWASECRASGYIKRCTPIVFGGHGEKDVYFRGCLKSFRIYHNAE